MFHMFLLISPVYGSCLVERDRNVHSYNLLDIRYRNVHRELWVLSWENLPACVSVLVHVYVCIVRGISGGWQGSLENLISLAKF